MRCGTYHDDLWKVQLGILTDGTQDILELGGDRNQLFHLLLLLLLFVESINQSINLMRNKLSAET